jgi:hypothetical protein
MSAKVTVTGPLDNLCTFVFVSLLSTITHTSTMYSIINPGFPLFQRVGERVSICDSWVLKMIKHKRGCFLLRAIKIKLRRYMTRKETRTPTRIAR